MSFLSRLANVFRSDVVDDDLDDELTFHLEQKTRDLMAGGMTADAARAEARRRLGDPTRTRERSRDVKVAQWLDSLMRDVRVGLRMLRKDRTVTLAAVLSLGLAMGGCLTAFSLIDALLLRPLPVRDPERLIYLSYPPLSDTGDASTIEQTSFSYAFLAQAQAAARGRATLFGAGYQALRRIAIPGQPTLADMVHLQHLSGNAFGELGLTPALGRLLTPADDDVPGAHPVAVLSHDYWVRRFGGQTSAVGRWVAVEGVNYQVIGVVGRGFTGLEPGIRTDLWVPLTMYRRRALDNAEWTWFRIIGRLHPGVSSDQAQAALAPAFTNFQRQLSSSLRADTPKDYVERYVHLPLTVHSAARGQSYLRLDFERPLWTLAVVVGLVLLIACSNVANLLTARAAAREREMALRISIGAGRRRLIQQLLIESALMALAACAIGALLAAIAAPTIIASLTPREDPVFLELRADGRLMAFAVALTSMATMFFGLIPALRASTASPIAVLKSAGTRTTTRAGLLRPLVAAQMAFSLAVLFVSALLLGSFARLTHVDTGFLKSGIVLLSLESEAERNQPQHLTALRTALLDRVRAIPGVDAASLSDWPFFSGFVWTQGIRFAGRATTTENAASHYLAVSPQFVKTMGMRLLEGRDLVAQDSEPEHPTAVLVNEAFVRHFLPGTNPIGQRFGRDADQDELLPQEIVGLVSDNKVQRPAACRRRRRCSFRAPVWMARHWRCARRCRSGRSSRPPARKSHAWHHRSP